MVKIIAIANHKGGVAKTTSAINIGAALHKLKKKVLLIDFDPQSNMSQSLGIINAEYNIYGALSQRYEIWPIQILKGFDLIPSSIDLAASEIELSTKLDREFYLKEVIDKIKDSYDYIIIDCAPSLGILAYNAFTAADEIMIPLQSEFLATQGLAKLFEVIDMMKKRLNPTLIVGGMFLTRYDSRKVLNRDVFETIKEHFSTEIFTTKIRENIALAEAPAHGLDIFRYSPKSNGAEDYQQLSKEIIKRNKKS